MKLRDKVRDTITGYTGIVIGITQWLNGCARVTVQAQELKDGKPVDSCCFDDMQLEVVESYSPPKVKQTRSTTGGPIPAPARRKDVTR